MYKTLIYNLISLRTENCAEDLSIFKVPSKGVLKNMEPIDYMYSDVIYKLHAGSTYVLGPHAVINTVGFTDHIKTCYNIYKVLKMVACVPYLAYFGREEHLSELVEVEVLRSNNQLSYYNFLYGD